MGLKKIVIWGLSIILICSLAILALRIFKINIPLVGLSRENNYTDADWVFSIGIVVGKDPFHLGESREIGNPVLTAGDVDDIDAAFVADPFMIRYKNRWYMFFEVMNRKSGHGDIGIATSNDGIEWKYQQIVLDEPFHLSYPHVFLSENSYYMIPETNAQNEIRLYKSTNFPLDWQYEETLIRGLLFSDSTIFQFDGKWWIFTETDPVGDGTLRLYYSDSIHGPWEEHPDSPVIEGDANIARPAGKVLFYQNRLYRITQDDWPTYANSVRVFQIDELTTTAYAEHELCGYPEIVTDGLKAGLKTPVWRYDGFHQLDLHQTGENQWIACIDGLNHTSIYRQLVIKIRIPFTKEMLQ
jgi:hypothetical protein